MSWSYKIAEFRGIGVYLHITFLLLLGVVGLWSLADGGAAAAASSVIFLMALFGCVVLHEFGHALMAQRYGIPTRDITLLPIGGVARLERMPDDPKQELWVALAGPAVNVVIAAGLFVLLMVTGWWTPISEFTLGEGSFLQRLFLVNVTLVIFNLLPAFPMDGGRVMRSVLAMRMDYARATQIAAWAGQGMAVLFGLIGLFANPMLIFIAIFVWMGAQQEARAARMRADLAGVPVSDWMTRRFRTLSPHDTLDSAASVLLSGTEAEMPIVEEGVVRGFVERGSVLRALRSQHPETPVGRIMRSGFSPVSATDSLSSAFQNMLRTRARTAPVMDGSYLVGLIHLENLLELAQFGRSRGLRFVARRPTAPSVL